MSLIEASLLFHRDSLKTNKNQSKKAVLESNGSLAETIYEKTNAIPASFDTIKSFLRTVRNENTSHFFISQPQTYNQNELT